MQYIKNLIILVLVAMILIATSSFAQQGPGGETGPAFNVGQKWVETVNLNTQFPNPDKVAIGDTIWVEISGNKKFFVASDSLNSQWVATVAALRELSSDKNASINVTVAKKDAGHERMLWFVIYALIALIFAFIFLRALVRYIKNTMKASVAEVQEREIPVIITGPPIVENAPAFATITEQELKKGIELATTRTFHRKFRIIGEVLKGWITGRFVSFFADGSNVVSNFKNEPGYLAHVLFEGEEDLKQIVCQAACFNPLYTAVDAEFDGTFLVEKNLNKIQVNKISPEEIKKISHSITMPEEEIDLEEMADERVPAPVNLLSKEPLVPEEILNLKEVQMSKERGVTIKGDSIKITFSQLSSLAEKFSK